MGWELRLFAAAAAGSGDSLFDLTRGARPVLPATAAGSAVEERVDVYVDFGSEDVGVKFRGVHSSSEDGDLEVKVRGEVKKRGAERWSKPFAGVLPAGSSVVDVVRRAAPKAQLASDGTGRVRLRKWRRQHRVGGVIVEQTELEVDVTVEGGTWRRLPQRYRTICFEGEPSSCYDLIGRWLGLPKAWEPDDLRRVLGTWALPPDAEGTVPPLLGGYPRFVSAALAAASANASGTAVASDCAAATAAVSGGDGGPTENGKCSVA